MGGQGRKERRRRKRREMRVWKRRWGGEDGEGGYKKGVAADGLLQVPASATPPECTTGGDGKEVCEQDELSKMTYLETKKVCVLVSGVFVCVCVCQYVLCVCVCVCVFSGVFQYVCVFFWWCGSSCFARWVGSTGRCCACECVHHTCIRNGHVRATTICVLLYAVMVAFLPPVVSVSSRESDD